MLSIATIFCSQITPHSDGSEDHLVSQRILNLVGDEMYELRRKLMVEPLPKSLQGLISKITPPKGVKRVQLQKKSTPPDEGFEMLDCEGDEIDIDESEEVDAIEEEVQDCDAVPR